MNKIVLVLGLVLGWVSSEARAERIYDVRSRTEVSRDILKAELATVDHLIIGEKHYSIPIQTAQAALLEDFAEAGKGNFTFAWEFLNWSERGALESAWERFRTEAFSGMELLQALFGSPSREASYLPLFEVTRRLGGEVLATNLTRAEKAPVVQGGIAALAPELLPPGFELGGANYYSRFVEAMGGHGDPQMLANYFAAQSLVDDVVAYHLVNDARTNRVALVIGDFHTSYRDGVVARLRAREPKRSRLLVHVSERGDYSDEEWEKILHHPEYGGIADYVIFAD